MKTSLVIMAAGIGSRFGQGIKQMESVGPSGELIIDYSIHDAIEAGFDKIVFVIRHDLDADFRERIGNRTAEKIEVAYAYQELDDLPEGFSLPEGRTKPWGTGQCILACRDIVDEPFAVINADDYYGKEAFVLLHDFLAGGKATIENGVYHLAMAGFQLQNTLSDNGGVTRGICTVEEGRLMGIKETRNIIKTPGGAAADGQILPLDALVSMNFWCFPAEFLTVLADGFPRFLSGLANPQKDEYLLPTIVDGLLKQGTPVTVLPTDASWFGVTYKEDKAAVVASFQKLYDAGAYDKSNLYADL